MSSENKKRVGNGIQSWEHLKEPTVQPKGPDKPWPKDLEETADSFVEFLKDSKSKESVKDFLIEAYKKYEEEKISQVQSKIEHEKHVDNQGAKDAPAHYKAGNLGPALHEEFNMHESEKAFVRALRQTKNNLVRAVEDRVEEINRLLADIGGFSAQLKSSFARSTVVFLEQEDPKYSFRERLIFSINLPNYELKKPWDHSKSGKSKKNVPLTADGRTSIQATWDEAVNALAKIVETTGLKPKYCKNDRNYGRFVMKQDLRSTQNIPDEYFSFTLDYNTTDKIKEMIRPYEKVLWDYENKIKSLAKKMDAYPENSKESRYLQLKKKHLFLCQERDFFVGTTPDPKQLDEGLLFLIEVSTLKDYHIVKDRMQSIMTQYILHLSKIAAEEADHDAEMEFQLSKTEKFGKSGKPGKIMVDNLEDIPQYTIDTSMLKSMKIKEPAVTSTPTSEKVVQRKKKKAA